MNSFVARFFTNSFASLGLFALALAEVGTRREREGEREWGLLAGICLECKTQQMRGTICGATRAEQSSSRPPTFFRK